MLSPSLPADKIFLDLVSASLWDDVSGVCFTWSHADSLLSLNHKEWEGGSDQDVFFEVHPGGNRWLLSVLADQRITAAVYFLSTSAVCDIKKKEKKEKSTVQEVRRSTAHRGHLSLWPPTWAFRPHMLRHTHTYTYIHTSIQRNGIYLACFATSVSVFPSISLPCAHRQHRTITNTSPNNIVTLINSSLSFPFL